MPLKNNIPNIAILSGQQTARTLKLQGTTITYDRPGSTWQLDIDRVFFRSPDDNLRTTSLYRCDASRISTLAFAERAISSRRRDAPDPRTVTRQIYLLRNVYDWLSERYLPSLSAASEHDFSEMIAAFADLGWPHALRILPRWTKAINLFRAEDLDHAFHFSMERGSRCIEAINEDYWRSRLAWGGSVPVPKDVRRMLEDTMPAKFSRRWRDRVGSFPPPSKLVLRNTITFINQWHSNVHDCDKPTTRVSLNSNKLAHRLARRSSHKTKNLSVEDAASLLKTALFILDDVLPILLSLLEDADAAPAGPAYLKLSQRALESSSKREALESLLGRPVLRWVWSGLHSRKQEELCVDELVSAAQGAAFIVICIMNGRRSGEVCHPTTGLRTDSLISCQESLGLAKISFYIEKTRFRREPFFVNALTVKAFNALISLRRALSTSEVSSTAPESVFMMGRRNGSSLADRKLFHFCTAVDRKRTRSLYSFFDVAGARCTLSEVKAHSFRRFFALLYYYRYENSDLLSLQQHLRHSSTANTIHYITSDTGAFFPSLDAAGISRESYSDLPIRHLSEVAFEKLEAAIRTSLSDAGGAGGFTKLVKAIYRRVVSAISAQSEPEAAIARRLVEGGHIVRPMPFGQCLSTPRRSSLGNCRTGGQLQHAHSSPALCFSCPYHFTSTAYIESMILMKESMQAALSQLIGGSVEAAHLSHQISHLQRLIKHLSPQKELRT